MSDVIPTLHRALGSSGGRHVYSLLASDAHGGEWRLPINVIHYTDQPGVRVGKFKLQVGLLKMQPSDRKS